MFIGDEKVFSIGIEVHDIVDGWILGSYWMVARGALIGNREDHSVDLRGCWNWMRDFVSEPRDRYELGLYEMDSELVYTRLARSVLPEQDPHGSASEQYENTYSRFHMSHIGMSSFDNVTLLLVKSESGKERLVWRSGAGDIEDAYFNEGEIERVFNDAILAIRSEIDAVKDV